MRTRDSLPKTATVRKRAGQELTEILTCAVMNGPATVVITDAAGTIEYVNKKFSALTGYKQSEAIGQKASLLKSGLMSEPCYRTLWRHLKKGEDWTGEFHNRKKNGELYWERASISPVRDAAGRLRHYLKIAEDITEQKRLASDLRESFVKLQAHEVQVQATCSELAVAMRALKRSQSTLQRLSQEDALTGLLNRRGFDSELRRAKSQAERQGHGIGLLIIDIDHFKQINDRHGHAMGDRILKACAKLLRSHLRASDLICRYGGDEIVVALPSSDAEATCLTAQRILTAVRQHDFSNGPKELSITVSIGAACGTPMPGQSLEEMIMRADQALYRIKRSGRDGLAFENSGNASAAEAGQSAVSGKGVRGQPGRLSFDVLMAMLDAREKATADHCKRVAKMAGALARAMALPPDQIEFITRGALLHDIGKIAIPDMILLKPSRLTAEERKIVQEHPEIGYDILQHSPEFKSFSEVVRSHHERLDGSGYPRGLKGAQICIGARILAVADTYDAMRAGRPYAAPRPAEVTLGEIQRGRGVQFDTDVVDALVRCRSELEAVLNA